MDKPTESVALVPPGVWVGDGRHWYWASYAAWTAALELPPSAVGTSTRARETSHDWKPATAFKRLLPQREHMAVTVWRNGESVVTIETNCLSGRNLLPGDDEVIRDAARNLLGFIGDPYPQPSAALQGRIERADAVVRAYLAAILAEPDDVRIRIFDRLRASGLWGPADPAIPEPPK